MEKLIIKTIKYLLICCFTVLLWTSCKKDNEGFANPSIISGPDSAAAGSVVILEGKDMARITNVTVENGNVPVFFNPVFNNPEAIVFRIPDSAWGGPTNIILTNEINKVVIFPIVVVTPPVLESASTTDFVEGTEIKLVGNNFESVSTVDLVDMNDVPTGQSVQIVTKAKKEMVIIMPATNASRVKLKISNSSKTVITALNFINLTNASFLFKDDYGTQIENWSWGTDYTFAVSQEEKLMGTSSLKIVTGTGSNLRLVRNTTEQIPFGNYTNLSFWIKGADVPTDYIVYLAKDAGTFVAGQFFTIPANKWTYVTYPLQIWKTEGMTKAWGLRLQLLTSNKTVYLDNLVLN